MAFQLNKKDLEMLSFLAETRALTVTQLAVFQKRGNQVVRRRIRALSSEGLIQSDARELGKSRGRPEQVIHLTEAGIELLRSKLPDLKDIPNDWLGPPSRRRLEHQILLNWFRLHLTDIPNVTPNLSVRIISLPFTLLETGPTSKGSPDPFKRKRPKGFDPDMVFFVTHSQKQKTLLFFLEADRGTESAAGISRGPGDIRKKILSYQQYFRTEKYKSYENMAGCRLTGFRLLFLTISNPRLASLCNLVRNMPPSDFIWLTTVDQMFSDGVSAKIWYRGGKEGSGPESILGPKMARQAPLPIKK